MGGRKLPGAGYGKRNEILGSGEGRFWKVKLESFNKNLQNKNPKNYAFCIFGLKCCFHL